MKRGFTLLEMIVATLIMGIAVVGMLSGITGSLRNASRLMERDRVTLLARSKMNELLADRAMPRDVVLSGPFHPAATGGVEAGWQARVSTFRRPPRPAPGLLALDRIELEVWWAAAGQRRTLALEGYRTHTLRKEDLPPVEAPQ
jgi:general secretion pathway protein I